MNTSRIAIQILNTIKTNAHVINMNCNDKYCNRVYLQTLFNYLIIHIYSN